jgi:hypothetical protein
MPTANDIKLFGSKAMNDDATGGGRRSGTIVQSATLNNVFAAVNGSDRANGRTNVRRVWPSVASADDTVLQGATVSFNDLPTDAAVSVFLWQFGDATTTRAAAVQALADSVTFGNLVNVQGFATLAPSGFPDIKVAVGQKINSVWVELPLRPLVGAVISNAINGGQPKPVILTIGSFEEVDNGATGWRYLNCTVGGSENNWSSNVNSPMAVTAQYQTVLTGGDVRPYAGLTTSAAAAVNDRVLSLASLNIRLAAPAANTGFPQIAGGATKEARAVFLGDGAILRHEASLAAVTVTNGQTQNAGRTDLDQLSLIGNNGVEIARFLKNGPTVVAGSTANLAAGTVTHNNVSGYSQPVTMRHGIAERVSITCVMGSGPSPNSVGLSQPLARAFPSGSVLFTTTPASDVQSSAPLTFAQQAWTNVWSDSPIGNVIPLFYTGAVAVRNDGAETERWTVVMKTATTFDLFSQTLGKIASNVSTLSNYSPINPETGYPYFTLASSAWAPAPIVGSTQRFNTKAASLPVWVGRCVTPSSPTGTDRAVLRMGGSVA